MHGELISCQASALIHTDANGHTLDDMTRLHMAEKSSLTRQRRRQFQRRYKTTLFPTDYWVLKVKTHVSRRFEEIGESDIRHCTPCEHRVRCHFRWYGGKACWDGGDEALHGLDSDHKGRA